MLNKKTKILIVVMLVTAMSFFLSGCCGVCGTGKTNFTNKENLKQLSAKANKKIKVNDLRIQALRDTALSMGARAGLAYRARQINALLAGYDLWLARIFNFYGMLLDNNVLPPVLIEARNTLSLNGNDVIRIADRNYNILLQARFVTSPPHWRDYLWMNYTTPSAPAKSLLPSTKEEKTIWGGYIDEGWCAGVAQANAIFNENLARLMRDYNGMIRYRKLLAQNMVSPPFVAKLNLGITGCDSNLTVNDRVLKITAFPSLQCNGEQWKTEIRQYE